MCVTWFVSCGFQQYEPPRDKTNTMAYAPSEDSDQPGHPPSLIGVFAVRMKKAHSGCPGWSESSLGAHAILLVFSRGGSYCWKPHETNHVTGMTEIWGGSYLCHTWYCHIFNGCEKKPNSLHVLFLLYSPTLTSEWSKVRRIYFIVR